MFKMKAQFIMALLLVVGLLIGFMAGSFIQSPQMTTVTKTSLTTETVSKKILKTTTSTEILSMTSIKTMILTRTEIVKLKGESLIISLTARPYLRRSEDRWIWFNLTVKALSEKNEPIRDLMVVVDDVKKVVTNERGVAELSGIGAGAHKLKLKCKDRVIEKHFDLAFPNIDPDPSYINLMMSGRKSKVTFIAAYYGWYGVSDLGWRHWDNPENPATKYLPLLGQISGDSISQSYSLYGFSLNADENLRLVKKQIALAKLAGISAFAVSWWGPNSFDDRFMPIIIEAAKQMEFKVTVIFEPFYKSHPNKWDVVKKSIEYLEEHYITSDVWLKDSEGEPVIFTFDIGPHEDWSRWKEILSDKKMAWVAHTTDRSVLDYGFKYFYEYSPVGIVAAGDDIMRVYMGVSDIPPYDKRFIPTISPRYDDTKVRSPGYSIGEKLWRDSVRATKSVILHRKPEFVFITSWNEWHESTAIEPSTDQGFKFLIEFSKEFYGKNLSEFDFLKALRVVDCLELCQIPLI